MDDTDIINYDTAIGEASGGAFKEAILAIRLHISSVFRDGGDVIIIANINSRITKDEQGSTGSLM